MCVRVCVRVFVLRRKTVVANDVTSCNVIFCNICVLNLLKIFYFRALQSGVAGRRMCSSSGKNIHQLQQNGPLEEQSLV